MNISLADVNGGVSMAAMPPTLDLSAELGTDVDFFAPFIDDSDFVFPDEQDDNCGETFDDHTGALEIRAPRTKAEKVVEKKEKKITNKKMAMPAMDPMDTPMPSKAGVSIAVNGRDPLGADPFVADLLRRRSLNGLVCTDEKLDLPSSLSGGALGSDDVCARPAKKGKNNASTGPTTSKVRWVVGSQQHKAAATKAWNAPEGRPRGEEQSSLDDLLTMLAEHVPPQDEEGADDDDQFSQSDNSDGDDDEDEDFASFEKLAANASTVTDEEDDGFGDDDDMHSKQKSSSSLSFAAAAAANSAAAATNAAAAAAHAAAAFAAAQPKRRGRKRKAEGTLMSAEERDAAVRERNREHAQSTRQRKRLYVECLKNQVRELIERQVIINANGGTAAAVLAAAGPGGEAAAAAAAVSREVEEKDRANLVVTFLSQLTSHVVDRERWRMLVVDSFEFSQPRTPFRAASVGESRGSMRIVRGVENLIRDTVSITAMAEMVRARVRQLHACGAVRAPLQSAGASTNGTAGSTSAPAQPRPMRFSRISFAYEVDRDDLLIVGDSAMGQWTLKTKGLTEVGLGPEVSVEGMLKATFCNAPVGTGKMSGAALAATQSAGNTFVGATSASRLKSFELTFDVASFMRQLQQKSLLDMSMAAPAAGGASVMRAAPVRPINPMSAFMPSLPTQPVVKAELDETDAKASVAAAFAASLPGMPMMPFLGGATPPHMAMFAAMANQPAFNLAAAAAAARAPPKSCTAASSAASLTSSTATSSAAAAVAAAAASNPFAMPMLNPFMMPGIAQMGAMGAFGTLPLLPAPLPPMPTSSALLMMPTVPSIAPVPPMKSEPLDVQTKVQPVVVPPAPATESAVLAKNGATAQSTSVPLPAAMPHALAAAAPAPALPLPSPLGVPAAGGAAAAAMAQLMQPNAALQHALAMMQPMQPNSAAAAQAMALGFPPIPGFPMGPPGFGAFCAFPNPMAMAVAAAGSAAARPAAVKP